MEVGRIRIIIAAAALALDAGGSNLAIAVRSCGTLVGFKISEYHDHSRRDCSCRRVYSANGFAPRSVQSTFRER